MTKMVVVDTESVALINKQALKDLFDAFGSECYHADPPIDPNDEFYWGSLAYGFAIGKGYNRDDAYNLSVFYHKYVNNEMDIDEIISLYCRDMFDDED